jgi:hypothetical protein
MDLHSALVWLMLQINGFCQQLWMESERWKRSFVQSTESLTPSQACKITDLG